MSMTAGVRGIRVPMVVMAVMAVMRSRAPALVTMIGGSGSGSRIPALSIFVSSAVHPIPPRSADSRLK